MIYNFEFTLKEGKQVDLTAMRPNDRIVYFEDRNSYMLFKSLFSARNYDGEMMTKRVATGRYPDKFFDAGRKSSNKTSTSIILSADMYAFCRRKGIIGDYIRGLIQREMDKEHFNP